MKEAEKRAAELKYAADAKAAKKEKEKMEVALREKAAAIKREHKKFKIEMNVKCRTRSRIGKIKEKNEDSSCTVRKTVFSTAYNSNH